MLGAPWVVRGAGLLGARRLELQAALHLQRVAVFPAGHCGSCPLPSGYRLPPPLTPSRPVQQSSSRGSSWPAGSGRRGCAECAPPRRPAGAGPRRAGPRGAAARCAGAASLPGGGVGRRRQHRVLQAEHVPGGERVGHRPVRPEVDPGVRAVDLRDERPQARQHLTHLHEQRRGVLGGFLTLLVARVRRDAAAQLLDPALGVGALGERFGDLHAPTVGARRADRPRGCARVWARPR